MTRWKGRLAAAAADWSAELAAGELLVVFAWTRIVTDQWELWNATTQPPGGEFLPNVETFHAWTWLRECGTCAFWFGAANGGWPVAADVNGSTLHPLAAAVVLLWGVARGAKAGLVLAFFLAGIAQWWLARVLGLGRVARVWSACMAVVAGSLASRMELGSFSLVLSSAAAAMVWPPLILLSRTGRRREAVWLAFAGGSLLLAGNGYLQAAGAFAALLATPLLLEGKNAGKLALRFLTAASLALLLAAPVLVPFLHFLPEFAKDNDPQFRSAQPFAYIPLNLVIGDPRFYRTEALGRLPFPFMYVLFIGWIPVLLAFRGLGGNRSRDERRAVLFLAATALLAFWLASAGPQRLLLRIVHASTLVGLISGLRYTPFMAGLAVPPILGLAAVGLDKLLADLRRSAIRLPRTGARSLRSIDLRPLVLLALAWALLSARRFNAQWIEPVRGVAAEVAPVLKALHTHDLQWVSLPWGELFWIGPGISEGLKLTNSVYLTWHWRGRPPPEPILAAVRNGVPPGMTLANRVAGIDVFRADGREYAVVTHPRGERTVCRAVGLGGDIDVHCRTSAPGVLVVRENNWSGWKARYDRGPLALQPGDWLAVELPPGSHVVRFRYRPWDLPLGLVLLLLGVAISVWLLRRETPRARFRASLRPTVLQPPSREEDRAAGREKGELAPDISPEHAGEEGVARENESGELQSPTQTPHGG